MSSEPQKDKDLKALKDQGFTIATVTYEKFKSQKVKEHRAFWRRLAEPWEARHFDNRLDSAWYKPPFVGKGKKVVFPVEQKDVPDGDGNVKLKWTVWTPSNQLTTLQMEHYSVMRAEEHYISQGYTKIASKYYSPTSGPKPIPSENFGIDSFFRKGGLMYVACESKFTTNEGLFGQWKGRTNRNDVKAFLRQRLSKRGGIRQMTWRWINDRILRSVERPPVELQHRDPQAVIDEIDEMYEASLDHNIKRAINVYGAAKVPIYPGRYKFKCGERAIVSEHVLHLTWDMGVSGAEFMDLAHDFDAWIES